MRMIMFNNPKIPNDNAHYIYKSSEINNGDVVVHLKAKYSQFNSIIDMPKNVPGIISVDFKAIPDVDGMHDCQITTTFDYYQKYTSTYIKSAPKVPVINKAACMSSEQDEFDPDILEDGYIKEIKNGDRLSNQPITGIKPRTYKDDLRDFFFGKPDYTKTGPDCDCGVKFTGGKHSPFCKRYGMED